jgi:hypothetical protein
MNSDIGALNKICRDPTPFAFTSDEPRTKPLSNAPLGLGNVRVTILGPAR